MNRRLLTIIALLAAPLALPAQSTLSGKLVEDSSGRPMYCYPVFLLDSAGTIRDSAVTERGGTFELRLPDSALFRLRVGADSASAPLTAPERAGTRALLTRLYRIPWITHYADAPDTVRPAAPRRFRAARSSRGPEYPRDLQAAGTSGYTLFAFAIDPRGRIDTASALALRATHPGFARAVRDALPRMRFEPWTPLPHEHCALLQQRFDFALEP
jgi:hypothetical protein